MFILLILYKQNISSKIASEGLPSFHNFHFSMLRHQLPHHPILPLNICFYKFFFNLDFIINFSQEISDFLLLYYIYYFLCTLNLFFNFIHIFSSLFFSISPIFQQSLTFRNSKACNLSFSSE